MKILHLAGLAGIALLLAAAVGDDKQTAVGAPGAEVAKLPEGGLTTLWLLDGQANSMSLHTGEPGGVVQGHEMFNHDSQLVFGAYYSGEFCVGIQGGEQGRIVDLGTEAGLRTRFGYEDTVPCKQGFASLHIADGHFRIRKDSDSATGQPCAEADKVFENETVGDHAPVGLDHVYVVRIDDRHDATRLLLVKLHVVGLVPDQSVTVRWEKLNR